MCRISLDENFYTPAKAIRELDLPQTPIKIAIKETFDWLKKNDKL
jgi:dihydroflavonol-4-reductase